jgi:predicted aconitase with swiveling domain
MTGTISCRKIVGGVCTGRVLFTRSPINFLSAIDKNTGIITDSSHDLHGISISDTILIFPFSVGSTVGAYSIFSLRRNMVAPSGMICTIKVDITTASGCAIAGIPLVSITNQSHFLENSRNSYGTINADIGVFRIE